MYAAVVIAVLFAFQGPARAQVVGILIGATLVAGVGVLDDRGCFIHQVKLFIGMPLAAAILIVSGIRAQVFSVLLGGRRRRIPGRCPYRGLGGGNHSILQHSGSHGWLCAGIAPWRPSFSRCWRICMAQTLVTTLAAAVLGSGTGFLRVEFQATAKIFMGDGGAMFLGFLMATLGLKLRMEHTSHLSSWLAPILVLGVTIFDTTLVTISRARRGLLPFATPGKDHAAHRLSNLGLGHRGAVLTLYLLGAIGGGAAVLVSYLSNVGAFLVGALTLAIILVGVMYLERAPYERQASKPSAASS
jgi:UDP-GlcNAc:undecaprenyl-phosphate GlcNAc-1-phosphate transferase